MRDIDQEIYEHLQHCRECNRPFYEVEMKHRGAKQLPNSSVYCLAANEPEAVATARTRVGTKLIPSKHNGAIRKVYTPEKRLSDALRRVQALNPAASSLL